MRTRLYKLSRVLGAYTLGRKEGHREEEEEEEESRIISIALCSEKNIHRDMT